MSRYLPPRNNGSTLAIAICMRCQMKMYYDDLRQDPNNGLLVCKDCLDIYDPYRLPPRAPDVITLRHPRPDVELEPFPEDEDA